MAEAQGEQAPRQQGLAYCNASQVLIDASVLERAYQLLFFPAVSASPLVTTMEHFIIYGGAGAAIEPISPATDSQQHRSASPTYIYLPTGTFPRQLQLQKPQTQCPPRSIN